MTVFRGAWAQVVTRHAPTTPTRDRYNNAVPAFLDIKVQAIADYPGTGDELDNRGSDTVTADRILLLQATVPATAQDEWTAGDGLRYKTQGAPNYFRNPHTGTSLLRVNLRRIT